jgi:hypothetical protein
VRTGHSIISPKTGQHPSSLRNVEPCAPRIDYRHEERTGEKAIGRDRGIVRRRDLKGSARLSVAHIQRCSPSANVLNLPHEKISDHFDRGSEYEPALKVDEVQFRPRFNGFFSWNGRHPDCSLFVSITADPATNRSTRRHRLMPCRLLDL